ncbi:tRNA U-34 5-methylaminomethyl-2-thiouridine biosynthesis protein MnmC [Thioalkalivibrio sulfidiphilus HL-EbGr7]|uniref:tRNA 5-methylaminomethyl-2-thiouridine biosynthesis bifunctional protein MnmC n=1 Tax=Thioalkalivibrio sulfidiphilus (strain HL-EbGR7) TaxID=396588 RepID=B8GSN8_THISH|nr:bifunctional tRNA (5-methylaminomethyl-2-thiouridine)(34)-methyltransferase MnmD/FAD-dependent 5-carboxymethylaminomethyl-2-thiouridine(34) oxidoreductase MnmC [Thioalkalivibrio sulfidiphilus]ACL72942.1 tRNA U-34 5-methylaminomethyl-2-thiouridine biosynthesis protein MnmC [Thioalkalivibrio sulfidiphilus HL-EbGr7]
MASATDTGAGFQPLEPAVLEFRDGTPWSSRYGDVYFSHGHGAEESRTVFLEANGLPERWLDRDVFTIAETGFGTGLNFLLTWDLWRGQPGAGWLHYLSVELHPFTREDLARLISTLPRALRDLGEALLAQYPAPVPGFHRLLFPGERLSLTLMFGDAVDCLSQCQAQVDAWYLDGFAPARNQALWQEALYAQVARLTPAGGTLASFTAAGHVRRGLETTGFAIERLPGFGHKRERIRGLRNTQAATPDPTPPWYSNPPPAPPAARQAAVLGAGLAGSAVALALARRGWQVTVVDGADQVAAGASGNPAGILMPHLSADHGVVSRFTLSAAAFSRQWIESLGLTPEALPRDWCGALWLADGKRLAQRLERIRERLTLPPELMRAVDAAEASELAGVPLNLPGLFLPRAGWVDPAALCRAQLAAAGVNLRLGRAVSRLTRDGQDWLLEDEHGVAITRAPRVVLANGAGLPGLHPGIEPRPLRGQLSVIETSRNTRGLKRVLCYEGYLTPATRSGHVCGASFVRGDRNTRLRPEEHASNLAGLRRVWPDALGDEDPPLSGRAALRFNAPGRLPLAGPLPDMVAFERCYGELHHGRRPDSYPGAPLLPGVYTSLAHGSRGLTTAPLSAELLASLMHGDPLPLPRDLVEALHPARDRVRELRKAHS